MQKKIVSTALLPDLFSLKIKSLNLYIIWTQRTDMLDHGKPCECTAKMRNMSGECVAICGALCFFAYGHLVKELPIYQTEDEKKKP